MADSTSGNLTLPTFDDGQSYILRGSTINAILDVIKENKLVLTGSKQFDEIGPDGSKLSLDTIELAVCIGGVSQTRKFVIAAAAGITTE